MSLLPKLPWLPRRGRRRERGIAMLVVLLAISVIAAVLNDFSYRAIVDEEAAANARDRLRAEYLARSGVNVGRLMIKVQQSVIDRNRAALANFGFTADLQIADFAPLVLQHILNGGSATPGASASAIPLPGMKPDKPKARPAGDVVVQMTGAGKGAAFDLDMGAEDGKLNINCGGGLNDAPRQAQLYGVLAAMFWPPGYDRYFDVMDAEGQISTRDDVARAIVDWADIDEQRYAPDGKSGGAEDYRYDLGKDPYKAHNHFYDSVEEVTLVRGVSDGVWGSFGDMLTAYGGCKININAIDQRHWPLMLAILRATVKDDQRTAPILLNDPLMAQLAQTMLGMAKMGMISNAQQFAQMAASPGAMPGTPGSSGSPGSTSSTSTSSSSNSNLTGVALDPAKVGNVIAFGPRRVYRLDAVGRIERVNGTALEVRIRGIWDSFHFNQNTTSSDPNDRQGTWLYWRQE